MKYVTLRRGAYRYPVIFPDAIEHSQFEGADVVSAGFFCQGDGGKVATHGTSKSLKIGPKEGDAELIETFLTGTEAMLILAQI